VQPPGGESGNIEHTWGITISLKAAVLPLSVPHTTTTTTKTTLATVVCSVRLSIIKYIYTNADVAPDLQSNKVTDIGEEMFLMAGGSVMQFNEQKHTAIYKHLHDLPKHREFLSRFGIFYNQADEKEIDWHIKSDLKQIMELPESELGIAYTYFSFVL
jgi:hypothetical protein